MNKYDYLQRLHHLLEPLDACDRNDIMKRIEKAFYDGEQENMSEEDIIKRLGEAESIASHYLSEEKPEATALVVKENEPKEKKGNPLPKHKKKVRRKQEPNLLRILFVGFSMLLFNIIFLLAPFITVWTLSISLVAVGISFLIAGVIILLSALLSFPFTFLSLPIIFLSHPVLTFSFSFLMIGIGGLMTIIMIYMIRFLAFVTSKYVNWNIEVIRGY